MKREQRNVAYFFMHSMPSAFTDHTKMQSTLDISKSKGLFEALRDIHTSTYQICRIEEKINRTTTFNK